MAWGASDKERLIGGREIGTFLSEIRVRVIRSYDSRPLIAIIIHSITVLCDANYMERAMKTHHCSSILTVTLTMH